MRRKTHHLLKKFKEEIFNQIFLHNFKTYNLYILEDKKK